MVANNYLEIYTLIFGWNMYGAIWDVLAGTGLALIPIIAAVVSNFMQNYESGDAKSAIRGLEMTVLGMVLVMMLCVIPFRGWGLQLSSVDYNFAVPDCHPPTTVTAPMAGSGNSTGTDYDTSSIATSVGGMSVYKPVAWSLVEYVSSAITHSTIKSMGCVNNYELMLLRVSEIEIVKPGLRNRIRAFTEHCFQAAKARFDERPINIPENVGAIDDVDWIGSRILLTHTDEYYQHPSVYMTQMQMHGFNRMPTTRKSDLAEESGANPYCHEVWLGEQAPGTALGLRQIILDYIVAEKGDKVGSIYQDWMTWGSEVITDGTPVNQVKEDLLLKMVLQAHASDLSSSTKVSTAADFEADPSDWQVLEKVIGVLGIPTTADEMLKANAMKSMMKVVGPMVLALIQMVVIMSAVFVLILGRYKFEAFVSIALTYFSFEFINAIWAAAFWFDQQIMDLYLSSNAGLLDKATNTFLVSAVSAGSVMILPTIWLSIMAYSGAGMVRGMGAMGVGGGTGMGSAIGQGKGRQQMNKSFNNWQKGKGK